MGESSCWALIGSSGSGKSLLAQTLKGKHFFNGRIESLFGKQNEIFQWVSLVGQHSHFKDLNNRRQFYYQQRYNASDAATTITAGEELFQKESECNKKPGFFSKDHLVKLLDMERVLEEPLIQLSSGELKKLQIVEALIWNWKLLILDQPMTGLDANMREKIDSLLNELALAGKNILLITNPEEIPSWITHIAVLQNGEMTTGKAEDLKHFTKRRGLKPTAFSFKLPLYSARPKSPDAGHLINLVNVTVTYGQKTVLDKISWEIKKGEKWALSGPNGSGKSTLLSLICGDHPQAYANEIYLFGRRRGTGESIWDIKSNIGFLSSELQAYFDTGISCYEAIASGFFDTIGLFRSISEDQHLLVLKWLQLIHLENRGNQLLFSLSPGLQRVVLLARAMVKNPPLLILDEPCQGLDPVLAEEVRRLVCLYCAVPGSTLIYVTHYREEIPDEVTHFLSLDTGRISFS